MALSADIAARLKLPLISAPMLRISGPELVIAACRAGVIGAFPVANCRTIDELDAWLSRITAALKEPVDGQLPAPFCPNLIVRRAELKEQLACVLKYKPELVVTSVGSPEPVIGPLHDIGCKVFADVASMRHAEKAIALGVDGLVLLTAGAGGQTGWVNSFTFVRALRAAKYDGPIIMAGGIADGQALWAAQVLGCDLGYMGTKFIATNESMAEDGYKKMLVDCTFDDVIMTRAFTGLDANMLRPSIVASGIDLALLPAIQTVEEADRLFGKGSAGPKRWKDAWGAGHTVSGVTGVYPVSELIARTSAEYSEARKTTQQLLTVN